MNASIFQTAGLTDPWFWAFVSMFGLAGATAAVSGKKVGGTPAVAGIAVCLFVLGRVVLPLAPQPRFDAGIWNSVVGGALFAAGLVFCLPSLQIKSKALTAADGQIELKTSGFYGVVRNPIYLGELLWGLGWAILFGSSIGVLLLPAWWCGLVLHTLVEEQTLERELGAPYHAYKRQVRGRIIPGLPF